MAAYFTHAQMALETYEKLLKENLLKTDIDRRLMTTFSHGIDLSGYDYMTHNQNTQEFLLNFFKTIKQDKLIEDQEHMAMVYGHICHYFLDTLIHPYIYYIEKDTKPVFGQFVSGHTLVEAYISSYILAKRLDKFIMDIPVGEYFTLAPKKCRDVLDKIYYETYHLKKVSMRYQSILLLMLFCENTLKNTPLNNQNLCEKVVSFRKYLEKNELSLEEIANEQHQVWLHPVTGEEFSSSILDLFLESINSSIEAIAEVNKYLYSSMSLDNLKSYFPNISYDTGISLDKNQEMRYHR